MDFALAERLAQRLGARFHFPLRARVVETPGFSSPAVVPFEIPAKYDFYIALSRTLTTAEAAFRPDVHSGLLVQRIDDGVHDRPAAWTHVADEARHAGVDVRANVNGNALPLEDPWGDGTRWRSLEITCGRRLAPAADEAALYEALTDAASFCLSFILAGLEEVLIVDDAVNGATEGTAVERLSIRYERSPANRNICLEHHGYACGICGFDFEECYGPAGEGLVEVHHLTPLALSGGPVVVDPVRDLMPLCGNCHRMVHRVSPPYPPDVVRTMISAAADDVVII